MSPEYFLRTLGHNVAIRGLSQVLTHKEWEVMGTGNISGNGTDYPPEDYNEVNGGLFTPHINPDIHRVPYYPYETTMIPPVTTNVWDDVSDGQSDLVLVPGTGSTSDMENFGVGGGVGAGVDVGNVGVSWISVILMAFLIIVTIIGNVLVCLSVILVRKLRKPQNYLLVSLATSDLFVALFVMPFAIVVEFYQSHWPLTNGLCDLWVSADVLCCTASILNLCGISVDRYQAITAPFDYSARSTPRRMLTVIFVVWLGSACVSLPPVLLIGNEHVLNGVPTCTVSQNFWYQIYATMASFYIPLCVMVVVYAKILRVVTDKKKDMNWKKKDCPVPTHYQQRASSLSTTSGPDSKKTLIQMSQLRNTIVVASSKTPGASPSTVTTKLSPMMSRGSGEATGGNGGNSFEGGGGAGPNHPYHHQYNPPQKRKESSQAEKQEEDPDKDNSEDDETNQRARRSLLSSVSIPVPKRRKKRRFLGGLKEHKASTTLGIIMSAFIICWLPFFVLALVRPIFHVDIPEWITSLFNWLGYANSALNPVIYATLNRDFRRPFREILSFRCATLDSMMRKEFYLEQYGEDTDNLRNKASVTLIFLENGNISEPLL